MAARFLIAQGYEVLGTQVRSGGVEMDLIARASGEGPPTIVFVEVRARSSAQRGHALETIGTAKQRRLIRGATAWLVEHGLWERVAVRFDVIALTTDLATLVAADMPRPEDLVWLRGAFEHAQ